MLELGRSPKTGPPCDCSSLCRMTNSPPPVLMVSNRTRVCGILLPKYRILKAETRSSRREEQAIGMDIILRQWITDNGQLLQFVYGLVFFLLGFAIFLRTQGGRRLDFAVSLRWLGAFGLIHGFQEWADLFIPLQAAYVPAGVVVSLRALQLLALAISFLLLFRFGMDLLRPFPSRFSGANHIPTVMLAIWAMGAGLLALSRNTVSFEGWTRSADALSRYLLGLPAGVVSAYALRRYARTHIVLLRVPSIVTTLRVAGISLIAYAILAGIIGPESWFIPARILNDRVVQEILIAPVQVFRALAGLVLLISIIKALEIFRIETRRLIDRMERDRVISEEHERIARDLHDGVVQRLYGAGLLARSVLNGIPKGDEIAKQERVIQTIQESIVGLLQLLNEEHGANVKVDTMAALQVVGAEARSVSGLEIHWDNGPIPPCDPDRIGHLISFFRECLSNVVRHAAARSVEVKVVCADDRLTLSVHDNGRGLPKEIHKGHGIRHMIDRSRLLGGSVTFTSDGGTGTTVVLDVPIESEL